MKVYDEMAKYYDLIYNDQLDLNFYMREAKNARGSVLEVACGTGRIMLKLLTEKIDVTGIDISQSMLDVLHEKAKKLGLVPKVIKADMLDFTLGKKFKLIIVPYRSFLHLKSTDERKKALINFKNHLDKNGRLILHTYNPSQDDYAMTDKLHKFASEPLTTTEGENYVLDWFLQYNPKNKLAHYEIELVLKNNETHRFMMDISYIQKSELFELLKSSGYKNIKVYCGFDYLQFDERCREAIWIADF